MAVVVVDVERFFSLSLTRMFRLILKVLQKINTYTHLARCLVLDLDALDALFLVLHFVVAPEGAVVLLRDHDHSFAHSLIQIILLTKH